jgi:hypothetical protein
LRNVFSFLDLHQGTRLAVASIVSLYAAVALQIGTAAAGGTFSLTAGFIWHIENILYHKNGLMSSKLSGELDCSQVQP